MGPSFLNKYRPIFPLNISEKLFKKILEKFLRYFVLMNQNKCKTSSSLNLFPKYHQLSYPLLHSWSLRRYQNNSSCKMSSQSLGEIYYSDCPKISLRNFSPCLSFLTKICNNTYFIHHYPKT